ncbi:hypothetical protein N336_12719, partial [Phalacrocorax carbo]
DPEHGQKYHGGKQRRRGILTPISQECSCRQERPGFNEVSKSKTTSPQKTKAVSRWSGLLGSGASCSHTMGNLMMS